MSDKKTPTMVKWLVQAGITKSEKIANRILVGYVLFNFIVSALIFIEYTPSIHLALF